MTNQYEKDARQKKAQKLATVLLACGAADHIPELAHLIDDGQHQIWQQAAALADVKKLPSRETRELVVATLRDRRTQSPKDIQDVLKSVLPDLSQNNKVVTIHANNNSNKH